MQSNTSYINGVIKIEIVVTIEMPANKLVDFLLRSRMKILELVHCLELDYIQAIWKDAIWLSLQKVLALPCGDSADCGEYICAVRGSAFNAVAVIYATFASFMVNIKVGKIVVEIDTSSTEIATEKCCVCGKNGGNINVAFTGEGDGKSCLPFVEVGNYSCVGLACNILRRGKQGLT